MRSKLARVPWRNGRPLDYIEDERGAFIACGANDPGAVPSYWGGFHRYEPYDWRPNTPWKERLTINGMGRGRSAAYFRLRSDSGLEYSMRMACMLDLIQRGSIAHGRTGEHWWCFIKQGTNYSLMMTDPPADGRAVGEGG